MEGLLNIFEIKPQPHEEWIEEKTLRDIASKVAIWDHFGIPQVHYLALHKTEKSRRFGEYYRKLWLFYIGDDKNVFCVWHFLSEF